MPIDVLISGPCNTYMADRALIIKVDEAQLEFVQAQLECLIEHWHIPSKSYIWDHAYRVGDGCFVKIWLDKNDCSEDFTEFKDKKVQVRFRIRYHNNGRLRGVKTQLIGIN